MSGVTRLGYHFGSSAELDRLVLGTLHCCRRPGSGMATVFDSYDVVGRLRLLKDELEVAQLRRAACAAASAHRAMMSSVTAPTELELARRIETVFAAEGGDGPAYCTIVATAERATTLHAQPTHRRCRDGELVLVDTGCQVGRYACNLTRTFPVGIGFDANQAELYEMVFEAQRAAIASVQPGQPFARVHQTRSRGSTRA